MISRFLWKLFIMKQIITIAIVITVLSCGNQKAELTKQIEVYKDSLRIVGDSLQSLTAEVTKEIEENAPPENLFDSSGVKWSPKYDLNKEKERIKKRHDIDTRRRHFKKKIDSLELELKKY